jgi:hypothetical protein
MPVIFLGSKPVILKLKQMKKLTMVYATICCIVLCSCDFKCSVGDNKSAAKTKPVTSEDNTTLNGAVIKNDIDIEATGVKLKAAYLVDEKENLLKENLISLNQKIYLVLKTDTGWVKENGKSLIGAGERISTSAGKVLVDADDIFKDEEVTGMKAEETEVISLSAVITQADPGIEDFLVQFRVWDKKGKGEIKGKYKFSLKK